MSIKVNRKTSKPPVEGKVDPALEKVKAMLEGHKKKKNKATPKVRTGPMVGKREYDHGMLDDILGETDTPKDDSKVAIREPKDGTTRFRATKEAVDYRRKQVLRLVIRGVPKQTIAEYLGVSIRQVYDDVHNINIEMRNELQNFDYPGFIGYSVAFFDECRNIALRAATDTNEKSTGTKMAALRTALMAEEYKHEFFQRVGLFKVASPTDPFNSIQTGRAGSYTDANDIDSFMQLIAGHRSPVTVEAEANNVGDE